MSKSSSKSVVSSKATASKATASKATASKATPAKSNPFREGSNYHAVVECLRKLGIGKMHPQASYLKLMPTIMGTANWSAFKAKDTEGKADERCLVNATVVARKDYGLPLNRLGFIVRKAKTENGYEFGLFPLSKAATAEAQTTTIERTPRQSAEVAPKAQKANQTKGNATEAKASKAKATKTVKAKASKATKAK